MSNVSIIYSNRDNTVEFELHDNGVNISNYPAITRVVIDFDGTNKIDSNVNSGAIDWSQNKIVLKAGSSGIPVGVYNAKVITYDAGNTNGFVWTDNLKIAVR